VIRGLHWFRNDLRLRDNTTLVALAERVEQWLPVFVIDRDFFRADSGRPRARFLFDCLSRLRRDLEARGVPLQIVEGEPETLLPRLMQDAEATVLSFGEADTPLGRRRDARVREAVEAQGGELLVRRDHTVFAPEEIRTQAGGAYSVYTPYRNAWWKKWAESPRLPERRLRLPKEAIPGARFRKAGAPIPDLESEQGIALPTGGEEAALRRLSSFLDGPVGRYATDRDRPDLDGTSRLSPYLRFGAISVRRCFADGLAAGEDDPSLAEGASKWLDELVWREFYAAVLRDAPRVLTQNYRPVYDALDWSQDEQAFEAWCRGRTGYPFIDAGMRQLLATGWMHNRVRMVVASFLTKDLLIDWRKGARFFYERLVDGDPASNNGGWQWAASTGTDAQPYFRIFNPITQGKKWDPDGVYVRRYVPELREIEDRFVHEPWRAPTPPRDYPAPIVDHAEARERTLEAFKRARDLAAD
jgi:deoxyribodipyrimidine photo-lyase